MLAGFNKCLQFFKTISIQEKTTFMRPVSQKRHNTHLSSTEYWNPQTNQHRIVLTENNKTVLTINCIADPQARFGQRQEIKITGDDQTEYFESAVGNSFLIKVRRPNGKMEQAQVSFIQINNLLYKTITNHNLYADFKRARKEMLDKLKQAPRETLATPRSKQKKPARLSFLKTRRPPTSTVG